MSDPYSANRPNPETDPRLNDPAFPGEGMRQQRRDPPANSVMPWVLLVVAAIVGAGGLIYGLGNHDRIGSGHVPPATTGQSSPTTPAAPAISPGSAPATNR
jgi:hypothetical protein